MTKNSTQVLTPSRKSPSLRTVSVPTSEGPGKLTLEKIRQFARAYSYTPVLGAVGGMILN